MLTKLLRTFIGMPFVTIWYVIASVALILDSDINSFEHKMAMTYFRPESPCQFLKRIWK